MSTSLLSNLSRGYGTWTGVIDSYKFQEENLPSIDSSQMLHRHGITPRPHSAISAVSVADGGHLDLPKTYLTRKGALMLFTAPDEEPKESLKYVQPNRKIKRHKNIIDLSLKLKTLERLSLSILQFGDKCSLSCYFLVHRADGAKYEFNTWLEISSPLLSSHAFTPA
nr:golgin subfamily A member 6-like protein 22 [Biomphalaria glabrata]